MLAALLLMLAGPAHSSDGSQTLLGVSVGVLGTQFRDQQLTPLRHGGIGPAFGLDLTVLTPKRLDRLDVTYHFGSGEGWRWISLELDSMLAPRVLGSGNDGVYFGFKHDTGFALRWWGDGTWQSNITFGVVLGARAELLDRGGHRLWAEATVSTPLIGVVGRPGFAAPFQNDSMSLRDWMFASLHNHVALDTTASLLWLRPSGSHLRLELRTLDQRISVRHPVARSRTSAHLFATWRLS